MQDPFDLAGGGRLVDGNGDAAGEPDGEVHHGPLVAGAGHDGHGFARGEAAGDQPLGQGPDLVQELLGGNVGPAGRALAGVEGMHRDPWRAAPAAGP